MLIINLGNIEEILQNKVLRQKLPELLPYVDIWEFAVRNPSLKGLRKQSALDYLNALGENQIKTLEKYFDRTVTIDKLDNSIVKNVEFSIEKAEEELLRLGIIGNLVSYRRGNRIYLSIWK
jgi:hypothetical protein